MPRGPKGERRPADVIGNAVHVMRVALYTVWYNFVKQHKSIKCLSPAMAALASVRRFGARPISLKWLTLRCPSWASADLIKRRKFQTETLPRLKTSLPALFPGVAPKCAGQLRLGSNSPRTILAGTLRPRACAR
jgi:hypothetical protein